MLRCFLIFKCAAILLALSEERVQLSAGGLMPIGKELLPSVSLNTKHIRIFFEISSSFSSNDLLLHQLTATVITYLVILLQNAIHKKANQDKGTANRF